MHVHAREQIPCHVAQFHIQLSRLPMSASSATSDETRRVMTTVPMDNVVTTLLQHRGHSTLMSLIPGLNKMNWHSNVGHVLDAVLQALGLRRSKDGKEIWTDAAPAKLTYQETKSVNSRQPKQQRHTVAGQLDEIDLAHDARAPAAGSSAAQAAAEAARPPAAPQPLEHPSAADYILGDACDGWRRFRSGNGTHAKLGAKLKLGRGKGARLGRGRRLEEHRQERDRAAGGGRAFTDVRRCML